MSGQDALLRAAFAQFEATEAERWALDVKVAMVRHGLGKPRAVVSATDVAVGEVAIRDCERRLRECEARIRSLQAALGISPLTEARWTAATAGAAL